jgi:hypothetical protein
VLVGGLVIILLAWHSTDARADRIRWTVQAASALEVGSVAWELEERVARMTYGEMRLKAFAPGELAGPGEISRAVSIGAVGAAVLPIEILSLGALEGDVAGLSGLTGDPMAELPWLAGGGLQRLRSWAAPRDMHLIPCGVTQGTLSFLAIHLPEYRRLDRAQEAILDAACAEITLDGVVATDTRSD